MIRYDRRGGRGRRRYRRAVRRAFAQVTFYREQCAAAARVLTEPVPTSVDALPEPPHTLCPFARPWSPDREPSLWTPTLRPLARALRMSGCDGRLPVLEVRDALLDQTRLPRHRLLPAAPYRVLLSPTAIVASDARRTDLNRQAFEVVDAAGAGWVVGSPAELAAVPQAASALLRPVHRLPISVAVNQGAAEVPTLLYEPRLGYLGAYVPECRQFHLDAARVHARDRDGRVTISLPRLRRPTLLDMVPAGAERVTVRRCHRHGSTVLAEPPAVGSS